MIRMCVRPNASSTRKNERKTFSPMDENSLQQHSCSFIQWDVLFCRREGYPYILSMPIFNKKSSLTWTIAVETQTLSVKKLKDTNDTYRKIR